MSNEQYRSCLEACNACVVACERCAAACLNEQEKMAECIRLDRDCADICRLAAAFMARDSRFAKAICGLCATICDACAAECAKHVHSHCRACAEACRACARECRQMAG